MKNKTNNGKLSAATITFYVIAVLFLIYTGYALYNSYTIVSEAISYGSVSYAENWKEIVSVYVQNVLPFLAYTVIIYGIGYLIDKVQTIMNALGTDTASNEGYYKMEAVEEDDDDAFIASLTSQVKGDTKTEAAASKEAVDSVEEAAAVEQTETKDETAEVEQAEVKEDKKEEAPAADEKKEEKKPAKKPAAKKSAAKKTTAKEKEEPKKSEDK